MRNYPYKLTLVLLGSLLLPQPPLFAAKDNSEKIPSGQEDKLPWWPTDAQPAPVKDEQRGGYWWWPQSPGTVKELWGNRGYAYVNKIIYNWGKGGRGGTGVGKDVQVTFNGIYGVKMEMKPSLIVKRTIRSLTLYFKDGQAQIGSEHTATLKKALASLKNNEFANVLITSDATADTTGHGIDEQRAAAVEKFMLDQGIDQERINVVTPGKFEEAGLRSKKEKTPDSIQILVAEVAEVMIPGSKD